MSNPIVSFGEEAVKSELRELVRKTIEETVNAMLDEGAGRLMGAAPYERADGRAASRAGHCERGFTTTSGRVTLKMPKLKGMRFATAVVERCKRREASVEEASSRCTWPGCPRAASRTSARSCGARASPPARSQTSTTRLSRRSRSDGAGPLAWNTRTSTSTAST